MLCCSRGQTEKAAWTRSRPPLIQDADQAEKAVKSRHALSTCRARSLPGNRASRASSGSAVKTEGFSSRAGRGLDRALAVEVPVRTRNVRQGMGQARPMQGPGSPVAARSTVRSTQVDRTADRPFGGAYSGLCGIGHRCKHGTRQRRTRGSQFEHAAATEVTDDESCTWWAPAAPDR